MFWSVRKQIGFGKNRYVVVVIVGELLSERVENVASHQHIIAERQLMYIMWFFSCSGIPQWVFACSWNKWKLAPKAFYKNWIPLLRFPESYGKDWFATLFMLLNLQRKINYKNKKYRYGKIFSINFEMTENLLSKTISSFWISYNIRWYVGFLTLSTRGDTYL